MIARTALTALATALTLAAAAPAMAESVSRQVSYADLNLASADGRAALDARLHRAAKSVCAVGQDRDLARVIRASSCYKASVEEARIAADRVIASKSGASVTVASR